MKIIEIIEPLQAQVIAKGDLEQQEVSGGYAGDLLSDVIANAKESSVWVTIQSHPNVVAVAKLVGIPCIVVTNFQDVDEQTSQRAEKEGITILKTPLTTYQAVAVLSRLGLPGLRRNA
ncbi:MAG: hypothetical protein PWP60_822 [Candidatus Atribacteria bacterium]|jgi:serine kinase of HPr protein (carbohydrate metabolism regulator)|uniref:DRTGG domain-containing protein n=1 Tax=Thermatribacter velox TaxID=3039681 RepID=A0ABZ2Y836_9BACT|nr:hypothetical protein [Candidatus Atribacteria bacterium]